MPTGLGEVALIQQDYRVVVTDVFLDECIATSLREGQRFEVDGFGFRIAHEIQDGAVLKEDRAEQPRVANLSSEVSCPRASDHSFRVSRVVDEASAVPGERFSFQLSITGLPGQVERQRNSVELQPSVDEAKQSRSAIMRLGSTNDGEIRSNSLEGPVEQRQALRGSSGVAPVPLSPPELIEGPVGAVSGVGRVIDSGAKIQILDFDLTRRASFTHGLGESFGPVLAQGLLEPVAKTFAKGFGHHQALRHERREMVDDLGHGDVAQRAPPFYRFQIKSGDEH